MRKPLRFGRSIEGGLRAFAVPVVCVAAAFTLGAFEPLSQRTPTTAQAAASVERTVAETNFASGVETLFSYATGTLSVAALEPGRRYDRSGRYQGRVTEDGRIYDRSGRYQGRVTEDGRAYDRSGRYQGKQTEDGRYYDRSGRYQGKETDDGRFYDRSGRYQGRKTEDGRYYDRSGRYQGRVRE
ncbi:hypothetical protein [Sutterella massiliensis]|uniref:hypothetical protein n=1 Tax=Sutterella massiliensis TaxID=1816689 RepID=UPI001EF6D407|nr:hypothetical protein [Sutterella massiliensis]